MRSNKKRFSLGLAVGLSLGLAGGAAYAGSIGDPVFTSGQTLTHTHMNNIRTAVNENHTGKGTCSGNPDVTGDTMVRVGSTCVDKYEASISGGVARSVTGVLPAVSVTWAQAADACAKAGKRLITNAEWQTAAVGTDAANCNTASATLANTDANATCTSAYGVVNMAGNAVEWVADWSPLTASVAALSESAGVLRGGDATDGVNATIEWIAPGTALNTTDVLRGFRCAR